MPTRIPKELPAGGKERKGSLVANTKYSVSRIQQTVRQAHCDISLEHQLSWRPLLQVREHQHQQNRTIHSWRFWIDSQSGGGPQILPFPHLFPQLPCHRTLSVSFCPRSCITVICFIVCEFAKRIDILALSFVVSVPFRGSPGSDSSSGCCIFRQFCCLHTLFTPSWSPQGLFRDCSGCIPGSEYIPLPGRGRSQVLEPAFLFPPSVSPFSHHDKPPAFQPPSHQRVLIQTQTASPLLCTRTRTGQPRSPRKTPHCSPRSRTASSPRFSGSAAPIPDAPKPLSLVLSRAMSSSTATLPTSCTRATSAPLP